MAFSLSITGFVLLSGYETLIPVTISIPPVSRDSTRYPIQYLFRYGHLSCVFVLKLNRAV